jgi:prophage maintenance system killer protein
MAKVSKGLGADSNTVIYQAASGAIQLRGDFKRENVWATQAQIGEIFDVDRSVITKHIGNIFKIKEVDEESNVQKTHFANSDKPVAFYSLDVILSVGYRVNSKTATHFRRWATKTLREHIVRGFTINRKIVARNYEAFMRAVGDVQALLPEHVTLDPKQALELVRAFADTWVSLEAYDKDKLVARGATKRDVVVTARQLSDALTAFKRELAAKGETSELFGAERETGSVSGIVGNVMQSFGGKPVYATVEEKAAHLLYFMVKNHPFADGNKRSGAFAFVWFLKKADLLERTKMTSSALTALTLFVAESDPRNKERMIRLVLQLLKW